MSWYPVGQLPVVGSIGTVEIPEVVDGQLGVVPGHVGVAGQVGLVAAAVAAVVVVAAAASFLRYQITRPTSSRTIRPHAQTGRGPNLWRKKFTG